MPAAAATPNDSSSQYNEIVRQWLRRSLGMNANINTIFFTEKKY